MPAFGFWYDRTLGSFQSDYREHRSAAYIVVEKALECIEAGKEVPDSFEEVREQLSNAKVVLGSRDATQKVAVTTGQLLSKTAKTLLELHAEQPMLTTYERLAIQHLITMVSMA